MTMTMTFDDLFETRGDTYEAREAIKFGQEVINPGKRFGPEQLINGIPLYELTGRSYNVDYQHGVYVVTGLAYV